MDNFGNYLKNERESRGVPLEEIADSTKVHIRFLQALENNQYDDLPGDVFIKGYIRSYAKTIGGNAEEMLVAYDQFIGKERASEVRSREKLVARQQEHKQQIRWALLVLSLVGFIALMVFGYQKLQGKSSSENFSKLSTSVKPSAIPDSLLALKAETDSDIIPALVQAETDIIPAMTKTEMAGNAIGTRKILLPQTVNENKTNFDRESSPKSQDYTSPLKLTIITTEKSWFSLVTDGIRLWDFILPAASKKTFKAEKTFLITIGNRKGVTLTLNGNPVDLPEDQNNDNVVKDYFIQGSGVQ